MPHSHWKIGGFGILTVKKENTDSQMKLSNGVRIRNCIPLALIITEIVKIFSAQRGDMLSWNTYVRGKILNLKLPIRSNMNSPIYKLWTSIRLSYLRKLEAIFSNVFVVTHKVWQQLTNYRPQNTPVPVLSRISL